MDINLKTAFDGIDLKDGINTKQEKNFFIIMAVTLITGWFLFIRKRY